MNILLLCFGNNTALHIQTYFAILTILKYKNEDDTVTIYTDHPEYYKRLEHHIRFAILSKEDIDNMIEDTGYIFLVKIKAVMESAKANPDRHLLFIDCDTCFYCKMDEIRALLDNGQGVMYNDEGHPSQMKGKSLRMWNVIKGMNIGDTGSRLSMKHNMWNSGVIGIPKEKLNDVLPLALNLCNMILRTDGICFIAEQYSFSVAMAEHLTLHPATPWVGHYWGNKDGWTAYISDFLVRSHVNGWTVDDEIGHIDTEACSRLPLRIKKPKMNRRLVNLANRLFPNKIFK